jgi:hypothetical protein
MQGACYAGCLLCRVLAMQGACYAGCLLCRVLAMQGACYAGCLTDNSLMNNAYIGGGRC